MQADVNALVAMSDVDWMQSRDAGKRMEFSLDHKWLPNLPSRHYRLLACQLIQPQTLTNRHSPSHVGPVPWFFQANSRFRSRWDCCRPQPAKDSLRTQIAWSSSTGLPTLSG